MHWDLEQMKRAWDQANVRGEILWRADTLRTRTVNLDGVPVEIVHNAVRDAYDLSPKTIDRAQAPDDPFAHNPLLLETKAFKFYGNPFSCMQYQCILVPHDTRTPLNLDFVHNLVAVAQAKPELRILYNGLGAGKTVPHEFALLSLHHYPGLAVEPSRDLPSHPAVGIVTSGGTYRFVFPLDHQLLWTLCAAQHPFDFILHDGLATFIPRKPIEAPLEKSYRFGGLEMIGTFIVKSREQFDTAEPSTLWQAAVSVCLDEMERSGLEQWLAQQIGAQ